MSVYLSVSVHLSDCVCLTVAVNLFVWFIVFVSLMASVYLCLRDCVCIACAVFLLLKFFMSHFR